jgi:hypothetical protein
MHRVTLRNQLGNHAPLHHSSYARTARETEVQAMNAIFNTDDPGPIAGVEIGIPVVDVDDTALGVFEQCRAQRIERSARRNSVCTW